MTGDEITLTIPREEPFREVAQLVLAGFAARLNLTYESLDDLETALDAVLERASENGDVTVKLRVADGAIHALVGPFVAERLRAELEREPGQDVDLRRILDTVVDRYTLDQEGWLELTKRVEREQPA
jgi:anti-sigma regulatory factor (Ser/Thr protein kinase)